MGAHVPLKPSHPHRFPKKRNPMKIKRPFDRLIRRAVKTMQKVSKSMRKAFPYEEAERVSWAIVMEEGVGEEGENHTINMETTDLKGGTGVAPKSPSWGAL